MAFVKSKGKEKVQATKKGDKKVIDKSKDKGFVDKMKGKNKSKKTSK